MDANGAIELVRLHNVASRKRRVARVESAEFEMAVRNHEIATMQLLSALLGRDPTECEIIRATRV